MKVFELAKKYGKDNKELLDVLKKAGYQVKTPVSLLPMEKLEDIKILLGLKEEVVAKPLVTPATEILQTPISAPSVVPQREHTKKERRQLKKHSVPGVDGRFSQYAVGIRRVMENDRMMFYVVSYLFDPDTMETKVASQVLKRTESDAIMSLKSELYEKGIL